MKTYLMKVGALYVTPSGGLSVSQADALRISYDALDVEGARPRPVKLRLRSLTPGLPASCGTEVDDDPMSF